MSLNPLNYATLKPSQRLVKAGIVLETEQYFEVVDHYVENEVMVSIPQGTTDAALKSIKYPVMKKIPRPSMAEVWRELPGRFNNSVLDCTRASKGTTVCGYFNPVDDCWICRFDDINPTDALIDLLIWVKGQAESKG